MERFATSTTCLNCHIQTAHTYTVAAVGLGHFSKMHCHDLLNFAAIKISHTISDCFMCESVTSEEHLFAIYCNNVLSHNFVQDISDRQSAFVLLQAEETAGPSTSLRFGRDDNFVE